MLDIRFIRENKEAVKKAALNKGIDVNLEKLLALDKERRELIQEIEKLKSLQNKLSKEEIEEGRKLKEEIKKIQPRFLEVEEEYKGLMHLVPNVYSEDTPVGKDDSENIELYKKGEIPSFDFPVKDHIELGKELDLIDLEKGAKTSGFRGYYLKNEAVLLSMALIWRSILKMREKGFSLMISPAILKEFPLFGSGHFPFAREEVYGIGKDAYLAGTSEPSLLSYFADTIFKKEDLPKKVCGFSSCYRSEAGSYGKDAKGLYRVHEFMKVEQVVLSAVEDSDYWLEEMKKISEEVLSELNLPYRVMQICTGDMGAGKYKMYDIETWMPGRGKYGETHSDSNLTDWQARRLGIRYKNGEGEKLFVHTLNNTVIASPRILIAIFENYQRKDGTIEVPQVLKKYLPFDKIG